MHRESKQVDEGERAQRERTRRWEGDLRGAGG